MIVANESGLKLPDEIKTKDSIILDATALAQQYVRPEQDLLDFTDADMAVIEGHYVKAYAHLDNLMAASSVDDRRDDVDDDVDATTACVRR